MSEWKEYKIGDILQLEYGKSLMNYQEGVGLYDVFGTNGKIGKTDKYLYNKPSIIIGRKGAYREVHFADNPFFVIDTAFYTKNKFEWLDTSFLYYWFKNIDINQMDSGSAIPSTSRDEVYDLDILLPNKMEQKSISSILANLDDKIDLLHRQDQTLEKMAETLFRQWFVEEAKEEWRMGNINDLITIYSGFAFKSSSYVEDGKFSLITIKSVQDGYLDLTKADRINSIPPQMPEYCHLDVGDILLSLTGNVARCCFVDARDLLLNQRVAKLKPKNNRDFAFTYILFRQNSMRMVLEELAKGTAQANLSPIETGHLTIIIPDDDTLSGFSIIATPLIQKILSNKKQIKILTPLRDILLPKLMSGEVKVNI